MGVLLLSQGRFPVKFEKDGSFSIGRCSFGGPGVGLTFTFPLNDAPANATGNVGGAIGMVVMGTDAAGLRDALSLGQPTIPPMVRAPYTNMQPDFVVTGPDFAWKGVGGILAAGFWGNEWEFAREASYTHEPC
ncbi:hypothetical protein T484DRAFT_1878323 [Baffinella frigidus]|nr:hypothetical protein T484DRAFT_1878323 [Cryptophyta sp. CCMP2293]